MHRLSGRRSGSVPLLLPRADSEFRCRRSHSSHGLAVLRCHRHLSQGLDARDHDRFAEFRQRLALGDPSLDSHLTLGLVDGGCGSAVVRDSDAHSRSAIHPSPPITSSQPDHSVGTLPVHPTSDLHVELTLDDGSFPTQRFGVDHPEHARLDRLLRAHDPHRGTGDPIELSGIR